MASPRLQVTPAGRVRPISISPGSRVLDVSTPSTNGRSSLSDEAIWKRLSDAGFDEESIRRRDKAALIAYIAKLEAEVYDLQHNMGVLILERKDYASKYEEAKLSAESAEVIHMRNQAALSSALAEAKKREDNLKKAVGVEKECVANIEKALHDVRVECAEVKVAAESKMAEARSMIEDAQRKYIEAEAKLHAAESLQSEAKRCERAAGRKLQEVESREDDLRRRIVSFKCECDAKEKEIMLERQSLVERQKVLSEAQNKLLDGQSLLNQREEDILSKSQALRRAEKELEAQKESIAAESRALMELKCKLELSAVSLSEKEKAVIEKEVLLNKKEQELLVSWEKLASKEHNEVQKLIAEQEKALKLKRDEFEAQLLVKQKLAEEDIETKKRAWELRELDLKQREDVILEKEQEIQVQYSVIEDKGKELAEKIKSLAEKETHLNNSEKEFEITKTLLQKEREEIDQTKIDLEKSLVCLEDEKRRISEATKELELMKSETSELMILETKLKEEIDMIRAQKLQLETEAEKLMVEKGKFETEWEFIDEKREELRREEERIAGERLAISRFLKDERDSLTMEKEAVHEQSKRDLESLSRDREAFRIESQRERDEWFNKFQQERSDFLLDIECRKRELEDCINKRREEIESCFREKEKAFEQEKKRELEHISYLKEDLMNEQERVTLALNKLETEKLEIKLDREQRDKAWAELQSLIEELQMQRLKLKDQRELLHADRQEIYSQIEHLKKLEDLKDSSDKIFVPDSQKTSGDSINPRVFVQDPQMDPTQKVTFEEDRPDIENASPPSYTVSWLKKCASLIYKHSLDKVPLKHVETSLDSEFEDGKLGFVEKELLRIEEKIGSEKGMLQEFGHVTSCEEPKVIHEVPSVYQDATEMSDPEASGTFSGRKRRVDDSSALETDDVLLNGGKFNKKRRQQVVDALDGSQDNNALPCVELKQPTIAEDQYIVSSSTQSERSKEKAVDLPNEVEGDSGITPEVTDAGKYHTLVHESEACESGLGEDKALRCVILEQTVIQEVLIVDGGDANRTHESHEGAAASDPKEQECKDSSDTKLENQEEADKERARTRSKAKQKS